MAPLQVGLTGGIASGKSTVGAMLAELGCVVTDADALVAELYGPGERGAATVAELFGAEMLKPDGSVDKEALGRLVFSDPASRERLERAIHPLVGQRYLEVLGAAGDGAVVVFEVPLLAEGGRRGRYDAVVTVEAPEQLRLDRAVERGLDRDQAAARMAAQATTEQRRAAADFVIENTGGLAELRSQVEAVHSALSDRARHC
ncbi:MAG: dephospho-CoA kinase [Acidobacteria bacterium]|nr:dephospho-CoA kinase [Acidobacteriota bacterium]MXZ37652.1 dephospho-CoA kinase [Holophagales bacterium]MYF05984.1 dephospho-CoA kinase [Holophagales bacterium]MYJ25224.1 dephospho-CoA kinase [Holophagales bacterium]